MDGFTLCADLAGSCLLVWAAGLVPVAAPSRVEVAHHMSLHLSLCPLRATRQVPLLQHLQHCPSLLERLYKCLILVGSTGLISLFSKDGRILCCFSIVNFVHECCYCVLCGYVTRVRILVRYEEVKTASFAVVLFRSSLAKLPAHFAGS